MLFLQDSYKPAVATSFKCFLKNSRSRKALRALRGSDTSSKARHCLGKEPLSMGEGGDTLDEKIASKKEAEQPWS